MLGRGTEGPGKAAAAWSLCDGDHALRRGCGASSSDGSCKCPRGRRRDTAGTRASVSPGLTVGASVAVGGDGEQAGRGIRKPGLSLA